MRTNIVACSPVFTVKAYWGNFGIIFEYFALINRSFEIQVDDKY